MLSLQETETEILVCLLRIAWICFASNFMSQLKLVLLYGKQRYQRSLCISSLAENEAGKFSKRMQREIHGGTVLGTCDY
jgi:hypothetical protein